MRRGQTQLCRSFPTRLQLLAGFSVLVALFVAALALGTGQILRDGIRDAALSGAEQTGRVFAESEVGPEEYKDRKLRAKTHEDLDAAVEASSTLRAARVWGDDHELLYSSGGRETDRPVHPPGPPESAFRGELGSITSGGRLQIYVPVQLAGDRRPRSVLELHLPYAEVQAKIDRRTWTLAVVLGLGALLFYAALLPTVLRGSGALADLYEVRRTSLQRRVRRGIRDNEFALVYQPKLSPQTDRIEGVEALLRWRLPDGTTVPPAEFIPLVEPTAVMSELTTHVFELALRQSAAWVRQGVDLNLAVNISACNLAERDLPDRLAQLTTDYGLSPEGFTLEVTESAMSRRPDRDLQTLVALRARGFRLSIDDFGTGESSLSRIHTVEFQEVKIDRSFVRRLDEQGDSVLIASIIDLARALGATVVAEGVESEAAIRHLTELGCDVIQGYQLARPLTPEGLVEWLQDFSAVGPATPERAPAAIA